MVFNRYVENTQIVLDTGFSQTEKKKSGPV